MQEEKKERNVLIGKRSRQIYKLARVSGPLLYKLKHRVNNSKEFIHCPVVLFNWLVFPLNFLDNNRQTLLAMSHGMYDNCLHRVHPILSCKLC